MPFQSLHERPPSIFQWQGKVGPPHYDQIGRFMFIILPGARPGLGTQPSQEAPGVLRLETEKPSD